MSLGFHGKSIEEIVELRFKEYEMRKRREREELEALRAAHEENKRDVTTPVKAVQPAPAHQHFQSFHRLMHKFGLE